MSSSPVSSIQSEFENMNITSIPSRRSSRLSSSSRESMFAASKIKRRNQSFSSSTPPGKRRKQTPSYESSTGSSFSSEVDRLSESTESSNSDDSEFAETSKVKKVKTIGKDYALLRPKTKNSLYAQIIQNSANMNLVNTWICLYESSPSDAMNLLLNLLINVMGYQNVDINDNMDFVPLRKHLEQNTNKTQEELICIFRSRSPFAKTFIMACFTFFQNLIHACDQTKILYDSAFHETLVPFISEMCKSNSRVIIVTICSIAINLCTHLLSIWNRFENNMNSSRSSNSSSLVENSDFLSRIIEILLNNILKYSTVQDAKLHMLRIRCAEEFGVWMKKYPGCFIKEQIFHKLRKLIVDEKASVRVAALKSCTIIVKKEKYMEYINADQANFSKLCNTAVGRLKDNNVDVEIMAVRFLNKSSVLYPKMLTADIQQKIFDRIYVYNYKLARECALFCSKTFFGSDSIQRLNTILMLDELPEYADHTEVLVHTLIGCLPEFSNIEFIINLIKTGDGTFSTRQSVKLLEIIYHMTNILVNGKLGYSRSVISVGMDANKMNDYIGDKIFANISFLFTYFSEDETSLIWILKTLTIIDITQLTSRTCREHIKNMVTCLINIMKNSLNKTILSLTSEILNKLSEEASPYSRQYYEFFVVYFNELFTQYQNLKKQTITEDDYISIRNSLYVVSVISEHHSYIKGLDWNNIYSKWENGNTTNEIIKYQMICCQHYLKWLLKKILASAEERSTDSLYFKECMDDFLTSCTVILETTKSDSLLISTYLCICEFFLECKRAQIQPWAALLIETLNICMSNYSGLTEVMESFVTTRCFNLEAGNLLGRRNYLIKYVTLIILGVIKIEKLVLVMKHYHLFKDDYQSIYKVIFDKLNGVSDRQLSICFFKTLLTLFLENEQPKFLKVLSVDLADIQPRLRNYHIIEIGINHILAHKQNLKFILVLKPFVEKCPKNIRLQILKYVQFNCPANYYKDEAFVLFLQALKLKGLGDNLAPEDMSFTHSAVSNGRTPTRSIAEISYTEMSTDDDDNNID